MGKYKTVTVVKKPSGYGWKSAPAISCIYSVKRGKITYYGDISNEFQELIMRKKLDFGKAMKYYDAIISLDRDVGSYSHFCSIQELAKFLGMKVKVR